MHQAEREKKDERKVKTAAPRRGATTLYGHADRYRQANAREPDRSNREGLFDLARRSSIRGSPAIEGRPMENIPTPSSFPLIMISPQVSKTPVFESEKGGVSGRLKDER